MRSPVLQHGYATCSGNERSRISRVPGSPSEWPPPASAQTQSKAASVPGANRDLSGLRLNRGFLHADPASFVHELTPVPKPADLFTTIAFSRVFSSPWVSGPPLIDVSFRLPAFLAKRPPRCSSVVFRRAGGSRRSRRDSADGATLKAVSHCAAHPQVARFQANWPKYCRCHRHTAPGPASKSVVNLKCLLRVPPELGCPDLPRLARTIERQKRVKSEEYFCRQSGFCRYRFVCSRHFRAVWNS
jgi:hypothetical protein